MSYWNYRIVRTDHPDWVWAKDNLKDTSDYPRYRYGLHEAYYEDGAAAPHSWTVAPVAVWADDLDGLRSTLHDVLDAASLAVLDDTDDTDRRDG